MDERSLTTAHDIAKSWVWAFTGPRMWPMTGVCITTVARLLKAARPKQLLNGCAVGCDENLLYLLQGIASFHGALPLDLHSPAIPLRLYPASEHRKHIAQQILVNYPASVQWEPVLPPLARNCRMVDHAQVLLCTPHTKYFVRGGTWHTINYAIELEKPVVAVYPTGVWEMLYEPET